MNAFHSHQTTFSIESIPIFYLFNSCGFSRHLFFYHVQHQTQIQTDTHSICITVWSSFLSLIFVFHFIPFYSIYRSHCWLSCTSTHTHNRILYNANAYISKHLHSFSCCVDKRLCQSPSSKVLFTRAPQHGCCICFNAFAMSLKISWQSVRRVFCCYCCIVFSHSGSFECAYAHLSVCVCAHTRTNSVNNSQPIWSMKASEWLLKTVRS